MLGVTLIFATDLHHLVIAALNDSYTLFEPGEVPATGDVAALVTSDRRPAPSASASSCRRRSWCSGCCSISGSACCRG